jgi:hypothetical protein
LNVIYHDLEFGKLDFNDLGIAKDWLESVQGLVGPADPDEQLVKGMLELSEPEQRLLKLLLAVADGLVQFIPAAINVAERLLNGAGLTRSGVLSEIDGLSVKRRKNM